MNRLQKSIISQALDQPEVLSDWEYDFINDIADRDEDGDYALSDKQNAIVNRIGNKLK